MALSPTGAQAVEEAGVANWTIWCAGAFCVCSASNTKLVGVHATDDDTQNETPAVPLRFAAAVPKLEKPKAGEPSAPTTGATCVVLGVSKRRVQPLPSAPPEAVVAGAVLKDHAHSVVCGGGVPLAVVLDDGVLLDDPVEDIVALGDAPLEPVVDAEAVTLAEGVPVPLRLGVPGGVPEGEGVGGVYSHFRPTLPAPPLYMPTSTV